MNIFVAIMEWLMEELRDEHWKDYQRTASKK